MMQQYCPECGGVMFYDSASKHYICKNCGLYITKDQLLELKERLKGEGEERKKRRQRHDEYLEWWLSKK
ncbi:MAG: hypothetical protein L6N95_05545 [Candidatus Methylarchaceae archaeon HK01B]|nr:hypothetical protein [Candidatus Methylarchaceae archaeon HK01B]